MKKSKFSDIKKVIAKANDIIIVTHLNPDGDAVGSSFGLFHYLKNKKKKVKVVVPNEFPSFLKWIPSSKQALVFEGNEASVEKQINKADLIFILDFNNYKRVDKLGELMQKSSAKKMLIDHHQEPAMVYDHYFHDVKASSTCELVYDLICGLDSKKALDKKIASCLYTGIMTDTGSFRFESTSQRTFEAASTLIAAGADNARIYENVFDDYSQSRLKLLGYCLNDKLVFLPEYNTAYFALSEEELNRFEFKKGDTEGIVNYPLSVNKIKFSAFFSEREGRVRISFRSKHTFDVNKFARAHFSGGGHINAAGAGSDVPLKESIDRFLKALPAYKSELNAK